MLLIELFEVFEWRFLLKVCNDLISFLESFEDFDIHLGTLNVSDSGLKHSLSSVGFL